MFLTAIALAMTTPPDRWIRISGSANLYEEYLDTESVRRTGDKVTLWTRRDFVLDQGHSWSEREIDCALRTQTVLAYIRDDGRTVSHNIATPHRESGPIPPGSAEETIFEFVCRRERIDHTSPGECQSLRPRAFRPPHEIRLSPR